MKKKLIASILAIAILASFSCAFAAAEEPLSRENIPISPRYEDIGSIIIRFSVTGSSANYRVTIGVNSDVTKIDVSFQLQKKNENGTYSNYGSAWTDSGDTFPYESSGARFASMGGTYRLKVTVTPYIGSTKGTPETAYSK